jgi:protein-S-isoprenylcysteine O-methyltransferase Ste14
MVLLKTIIFIVLVPGTVVVYIPYRLLASESARPFFDLGFFCYLGILPILLGAAINLKCAWDFTFTGKGTPLPIDPPKQLVVRGFYRWVRNPMYVGILLLLFGEAWLFESRNLFVYAAVAFLIFHIWVLFYEEPILKQKFGESYQRYCDTAPRWIPWMKLLNKKTGEF